MKVVESSDAAAFDGGEVHPVYSTFALGRDAEWTCRLFVIEMKENDEEGIGTYLNIEHVSPALCGAIVNFEATLVSVANNSVICLFEAKVRERLIAKGETGQKILKKDKIESIFNTLK